MEIIKARRGIGNPSGTMTLNDLIGEFGIYHWFLCFIIYINKFGIAFNHMAIVFLAPKAKFKCPNPKDKCCANPIYDTSVFSNTMVMEWRLICENAWLKNLHQMLFQLGVLIGSVVTGVWSDKYGRRPILILSVCIEIGVGSVAAYLPNFWAFTFFRMIVGFSIGGLMIIGFVIMMEYIGQDYRSVISATYQLGFTLGIMVLAGIGYGFRNYKTLQFFLSFVNVYLLGYFCFLPETTRWLITHHHEDKAIAIITKIAQRNGKTIDEEFKSNLDKYITENRTSTTMKKGTLPDLFRTPNMRKNILIMAFIWMVCSYYFYGVAQYVSYLSGNIFLNVTYSGLLSSIGCLLAMPLMKYFGRKTATSACFFISGVLLVLIAFIPDGTLTVILACLGLMFMFTVFCIIYPFCSEMFPTVVRNSAIGLCSMMARFGSMIAPFVAGLKEYGNAYPPLVFGILPFVAGALCLLLPETKNCELLTTLEQGENFGKKKPVTPSN